MKSYLRVLGMIATMLAFVACGTKTQTSDGQPSKSPVAVKTLLLQTADIPATLTVAGTVAAKTSSVLASQIMAQVVRVNVREGERVQAGQTLIVLNGQEQEARYASAIAARNEVGDEMKVADLETSQAKASLDLAEVTHGRLQDLFEKRSISNQELDESSQRLKAAQAQYDAAKARREELNSRAERIAADLRSASINKGYTTIAAPFSGVVVRKNIEPGMMAGPGTPLITVEQQGNYRLEAAVEESHLAGIRAGMRIPVYIGALNQDSEGIVSEVSPAADPQARSSIVKLDLPELKDLHSGMFAKALFADGRQTVLMVPANAVRQDGQLESVLVVDAGVARMRLITTGTRRGLNVVVLSGLRDGDRLIYPMSASVRDGAPVEVAQ